MGGQSRRLRAPPPCWSMVSMVRPTVVFVRVGYEVSPDAGSLVRQGRNPGLPLSSTSLWLAWPTGSQASALPGFRAVDRLRKRLRIAVGRQGATRCLFSTVAVWPRPGIPVRTAPRSLRQSVPAFSADLSIMLGIPTFLTPPRSFPSRRA